MLTFMEWIVQAFGSSTDWNHDNSYSSLTATSDALLSFPTPSTLSLHVSSLSTPHFATSYSLSTLGLIDGSISYLHSTVPLGHVPSRTPSIPLRSFVKGYRDIRLPSTTRDYVEVDSNGRRPTVLYATLALPPPSTLTGVYARRVYPSTLLSFSLNSKSTPTPLTGSGPPPASVLGHIQYDTGRYSLEALGSTDSALLGVRGLWNFGLGPVKDQKYLTTEQGNREVLQGGPDGFSATESSIPVTAPSRGATLVAKPSLLSAGAEVYYSPLSSVIGLSTGLRFTTLAAAIPPPSNSSGSATTTSKPRAGTSAALSALASSVPNPNYHSHSSFPYTLTLTLTPLTGSLASTYSVKPTRNLALSSSFGFNVYSWESEYVVGAEIWRRRRKDPTSDADVDPLAWAKAKADAWISEAQKALRREKLEMEEESVIKLRVDDGWNIRALWTGRVKDLLISAGVSLVPSSNSTSRYQSSLGDAGALGGGAERRWRGSVGVEVAYSS